METNYQYCTVEVEEREPEVENAAELIEILRIQQDRQFTFLLKVLNQQVGTKLSPSAMGFFYLANFYTGYSASAELQRVVDLWNFYNANALKFYQTSVQLTNELGAGKLTPEEFTAKLVQAQQNHHAASNNAITALRLIADTRVTAQAGANMTLALADSAPSLVLPASLAAKVIVRVGSKVVGRACATAVTKPGISAATNPITSGAAPRPVTVTPSATRPAASTAVTNAISRETLRATEYIKGFPPEMQSSVVRPAIEKVLQWERSLPPGTVIDQNEKMYILAKELLTRFRELYGQQCGEKPIEIHFQVSRDPEYEGSGASNHLYQINQSRKRATKKGLGCSLRSQGQGTFLALFVPSLSRSGTLDSRKRELFVQQAGTKCLAIHQLYRG